MASVEKIIEKMRKQPNNIRKEEMEKVLIWLGYSKSGGKTSHVQYRIENKNIFTLVWKNPVKAY